MCQTVYYVKAPNNLMFIFRSLDQLEYFLQLNNGSIFLKSHGQDRKKFITRQGLSKTFFECENHMWILGNRKVPDGIEIDGGSDWYTLTKGFCKFIEAKHMNARADLLSGLDKFYSYTLLASEVGLSCP